MAMDQLFTNALTALMLGLVLSLMVERSLATVFNWRFYREHLSGRGLKVPIALLVSYLVCRAYPVDLLGLIFTRSVSSIGIVVSAGLLAGGSKKLAETIGDLKKRVEEIEKK